MLILCQLHTKRPDTVCLTPVTDQLQNLFQEITQCGVFKLKLTYKATMMKQSISILIFTIESASEFRQLTKSQNDTKVLPTSSKTGF